MDIIDSNPFDKVTIPKRIETIDESEFENFYSKEELNEFLEYVKEDLDLNWYTYFRLLAYSGARKSELLTLKWSDIDFDTSTLNINKTLTRSLNNRIIVQPTKIVNGRRVIDMDYDSMKLLKQWKMYQAQFMLKIGFNTNTHDQNDQLKEPLIRSIEAHETIRWGIETDSNIKILQYKVENSDNIRNIYFLDDRVFFYDGALE